MRSLVTFLSLAVVQGNEWQQTSPSGTAPTARTNAAADWSNSADGLYIFGGQTGGGPVNDLQFYDRTGDAWQSISPTGTPPSARQNHAAAWSDVANGLYVFGGFDGSRLNDLHFFDRTGTSWQLISPTGTPPVARTGVAVGWSTAADGLYIFGGSDGSSPNLNDLWLFDRSGNAWQLISPTGTPPSARSGHKGDYAQAPDGLYVFGGNDGGNKNDLHFFDRAGNAWQQISPTGTAPSARTQHAAAWSDTMGGLYIFGGWDGTGYLGDLWLFDRGGNAWLSITPSGSVPAGRYQHVVAWSSPTKSLYMFGGYDGTVRENDLWLFQTTTSSTTWSSSSTSSTSTTTSSSTTSSSSSTSSTSTSSTSSTSTTGTMSSTSSSTSSTSTTTSTTSSSSSSSTSATTSSSTSSSTSSTSTSTASSTITTDTSTTTGSETTTTSSASTTVTSMTSFTTTFTTATTSSASSTATSTTSISETVTSASGTSAPAASATSIDTTPDTTATSIGTTSETSTATSIGTTSETSIGMSISTTPETSIMSIGANGTASTTTSSAELKQVYTRAELRALEAQRREAAAQAVAAVDEAVAVAVQQAILELAQRSDSGIREISIESDVGQVKVAAFTSEALAGGTAQVSFGDAVVDISSAVVEEVISKASSSTVLLSMVSVASPALRTDHIMVAPQPEVASQASSEPINLNFWAADGSRVKVEDLSQPVTMLLTASENATCAFWDDGQWSSSGVSTLPAEPGFIKCSTVHFSFFAGVVDVFTRNILLAFQCSTFSDLVNEDAFRALEDTTWLESAASTLSISFLALSLLFTCAASWVDHRSLKTLSSDEREQLLFSVKAREEKKVSQKEATVEESGQADDHKATRNKKGESEKEGDDLGLEKPPLEGLRGMISSGMDLLGQAIGGDSILEGVQELIDNADVASIDKSISMLQAHRSGADQATIQVLQRANSVQRETPREEKPGSRSSGGFRGSVARFAGSVRRTVLRAVSQVDVIYRRAKKSGSGAAADFLRSWWPRRVMVLFPAGHPWLKVLRFSLTVPHAVQVALIAMKIIGAGALSALFFSSSAPTPDSDPECTPPVDPFEKFVQTSTVGFVTACLGDGIILFFFLVQKKEVVHREVWTEKMKSRKRMWWRIRTKLFWMLCFIYICICQLYTFLFLANVRAQDAAQWLESTAVSLLQDLLLKPLVLALILATVASLMLCCRPSARRKIEAKWIESRASDIQEQEPAVEVDVTEEDTAEDIVELRGAAEEEDLVEAACDPSIEADDWNIYESEA